MRILLALIVGLSALLGQPLGNAAAPKPGKAILKIKNPSKEKLDTFGSGVAEYQGHPVITDGAALDGAGVIYVTTGSKQFGLITDPTAAPNLFPGSVISLSGDLLAVGQYLEVVDGQSQAGSVSIYNLATQTFVRKIVNPTPLEFEDFGQAVALDNDLLAVGAPFADTGTTGPGAVYLFTASTGDLLTSLTAETSTTETGYGAAVALTTDYLIVGALWENSLAGSVYIYDRNSLQLLRRLDNPDGGTDFFGRVIRPVGDKLAIQRGSDGSSPEAVYIFNPDTGQLLHTVHDPASTVRSEFGSSMAAVGSRLLVGAYLSTNAKAIQSGAAYLFDTNTGQLLQSVGGKKDGEAFGFAVSGFGSNLLIGVPGAFKQRGAAYVIQAVP